MHGKHVYPRTVESVSKHYKNPTKRVSLENKADIISSKVTCSYHNRTAKLLIVALGNTNTLILHVNRHCRGMIVIPLTADTIFSHSYKIKVVFVLLLNK